MRKHIFYFMLAAVALFTQSACEDGKDEFLSDYSTILYFRDSGRIDMTLYKTGEKATAQLSVAKAGSELGAVTGVDVNVWSEAALEAYNAENGTNYRMLPSGCYEVSASHLDFASSDLYKPLTVSVSPEAAEGYLDGSSIYVIPLELQNSPDSINREKSQVFLSVREVLVPSIGFETPGFLLGGDVTGDAGTTVVTQTVVMPIDNLWNFDCHIEVDKEVLAQYNAENADVIGLLPEGAYSLEVSPFTAGSNKAKLTVTIDNSKLAWGRQALPLRITGASNENFEVDGAMATCLVGVNRTLPRSELEQIAMTADRMSSNATADYDGAGLPGLVDGDLNTFWHGDYAYGQNDPVYGQYIDFSLPAAIQHFAYDFWTRSSNANGAPVVTDLYVSNDGQTWTKLATVNTSFSTGGEEYNSGTFSSAAPFTYLRFAVVQSKAGNCRTGSYWNGAEMKLYGR